MLGQNLTTRPIRFSIEKWHRWVEPGTAAAQVHTEVRVAIDALDYEYNHDARMQSPCLSAARLQLAVGRRGLGPRDREQCTQRAFFVATYHTRVHHSSSSSSSSSRSSCWARMLGWKKIHVKRLGTSLRGQTRVSQRRLGCLSPGPSEVHSSRARYTTIVEVVNVGLNFLFPKT